MSVGGGGGRYGGTSGITQQHQLNLNAEIAVGANPWLAHDPVALQRIVRSGAPPQELATNAAAIAGMESIGGLATALQSMNDVGQRAAFGRFTEQQQRSLVQMGYTPPEKDDGGFLSDIPGMGVATQALGTVMAPVGTVMAPVFGNAMNALTWLGDVPAHFYRAIRQMEGWQQWVALGLAAGAVALTGGAALAGFAPAAALLGGASLSGTMMTAGVLGGIGLGAGVAATLPTAIQNPTEWWDVMNPFGATGIGRGERIFTKAGQEKSRNILGNAAHLDAMARDIAANIDLADLAQEFAGRRDASNINVMTSAIEEVAKGMADPGTPEFQQVYQGLASLVEQEEFVAAVDALQASKISFGRDVANIFMEEGDWGYGMLSGSMDAMWLLAMDPTLMLGKLGKLQRIGRRGLELDGGPDAIQRFTRMVNEDKSVGRTVDQVIGAVNSGRVTDMPKAWRGIFTDMTEFKSSVQAYGGMADGYTRDEFLKYIEFGGGMKQIMSGKGTIKGTEIATISNINNKRGWGAFQESVKNFQRGVTDETLASDGLIDKWRSIAQKTGVGDDFDRQLPAGFLDDSVDAGFQYRALDEVPVNETWGYKSGKAIGNGILYLPGGHTLGNFISGISTMAPAGRALHLTGDEALEDIPRFVEAMGRHMNMPSYARDEWINTIVSQGTVAQKRAAVMSFTDNLMTASGMRGNAQLDALTTKYLNKYQQAYALGGADVVRQIDGEELIRGILPEQHQAVVMMMPDLRDMTKAVRKGHFLKHVMKVTDNNFAEQAMSRAIKPGWLLRIGFIPRAAGEEFLAFWLRMTEGGLAQEFAARKIATWQEYKQAMLKLDEAGSINKLSAYEQNMIRTRGLPTHMRPLHNMFARNGWADPTDSMFQRWTEWAVNARKDGLLKMDLPENTPDFMRALILGKDHSIRHMALRGVDPDYVEAGRRWTQKHATDIMRSTSANNASLFEKQVHSPDIVSLNVKDPTTGEDVEAFVTLTGERGRITAADPRYSNAIHHRANEWANDVVIADDVADVFSRLLPQDMGQGFATERNLARAVEVVQDNVDNLTMRHIVGELLNVRDENVLAAATKLEDHAPEIAEVIRSLHREKNFNVDALVDALRTKRFEMQGQMAEEGRVLFVRSIEEKLTELSPTLNGMGAVEGDARRLFETVLTREMLSDTPVFDVQALRAAANGTAPKQPKRRYFRGVRSTHTQRVNPDGSITLIPQTQTQWGDVSAVSMTTDPKRAAAQYGARRGTPMPDAPGEPIPTGAMIEFDADFMDNTWNTTVDDLLRNPTTYQNTTYNGDGMYAIVDEGGDGSQGFEIALATNGEVTIPAGKWKFTDRADYEALVAEGGEVATEAFKIKGQSWADVAPATDKAVDDFIGTLDDDERVLLSQLLIDNTNEIRTMDLTSTPPETVVGDMVVDGVQPGQIGDEVADRLTAKLNEFLGTQIKGDVTVQDTLTAVAKLQTTRLDQYGMVDDLFRERLGIGGYYRDVNPFMANDTLEAATDNSTMTGVLRDAWDMAGGGGWDNLPATQQYEPWYRSIDDARAALVDRFTATLQRPENNQYVKQADWLNRTPDGTPVVRPPADGLAPVYTPVVPPRSARIEETIDRVESAGEVLPDAERIDDLRVILEQKTGLTHADLNQWVAQADMQEFVDDAIDAELYALLDEFDLDRKVITAPAEQLDQKAHEALLAWADRHTVGSTNTEAVARTLLREQPQWTYSDELIQGMSDEEKVDILRRVVAEYKLNRTEYGQGMSQAMHGVGFDDPRIAKWVSSILSDTMEQPQRVGKLQVGRKALAENQGWARDGIRMKGRSEKGGRTWSLDGRWRNRAVATDAPAFHHVPYELDGKRGFDVLVGDSQEMAIRHWAEAIADHVLMSNRRGVKESQRLKEGKQVARRVGDRYEALEPGETMANQEELFKLGDDGGVTQEPVDFGSNEYFDHVIDDFDDELMWNLTGPQLRDYYENQAGVMRVVPKDFRERQGLLQSARVPQRVRTAAHFDTQLDESLEGATLIDMRRSRVEDVTLEPSAALPNTAIAMKYKQFNDTVWDKMVRFGFDKVIGPSLDALARKPMSFHYYAAHYKSHKNNLGWLLNTDLFEVQFADEFASALKMLKSEATMSPEQLADVRLLAKGAFGTDLSKADDYDVQRWMATQIGKDQNGFQDHLAQIHKEYRSKALGRAAQDAPDGLDADQLGAVVGRNADNYDEAAVAAAAERLQIVNRNAVDIEIRKPGLGGNTPSERLVAAYHEAVPDDVWAAGKASVTRYLNDTARQTGLPAEFTPEQWRVLKDARNNLKHIFNVADETAAQRAMENVIPFLDSHEQRSMFATYGKNMLPFWYAEENFIKRWARTMSLGQFATPFGPIPSAGLPELRKAQLTYMGIKSAGMIRTDNNGNDWIVYPGSSLLNNAVSKILPGKGIAVDTAFQARTESLLPGINPDGQVGLNPFFAVPSKFILNRFPDSKNIERALLGDIGSSKSAISQFIPSTLNRAWEAAFGDEDSSQRYASAMMQAIAFMEAEGNGLAAGATAEQLDEYMDRVSNHARIIMTSQLLAGFVLPGAPSSIATGEVTLLDLGIEDPRAITSTMYRDFVSNLGMEDGTRQFLATFPNADLEDVINPLAYTTSASVSQSGAPLPATQYGMTWYNQNEQWVNSLPEAGAWLIPGDSNEDGFDYYSYGQQLASGLRKRRTPQEYITAIKYRQGADMYFEVKDQVDDALSQIGDTDPDRKQFVKQKWEEWKTPYLAANPLFAERLQSADARIRRDRTVEQMRQAVYDPQGPESPYKPAIKEMVDAYDTYRAQYVNLNARRDAASREQVRQLKEAFASWATAWQLRNPSISRLWNSVYRPEANID